MELIKGKESQILVELYTPRKREVGKSIVTLGNWNNEMIKPGFSDVK